MSSHARRRPAAPKNHPEAETAASAPTVKDVARHAGVSYASASRVLTGNTKYIVRGKTREKILRAASELNYMPNPFAQSLRMRRSRIIGLCVPTYPFGEERSQTRSIVKLEERLIGMMNHPRFHEYDLMLIMRDETQPLDEAMLLRKIKLLDGMIYISPSINTTDVLSRIAKLCPLVAEDGLPNKEYSTIRFNHVQAMELSVEALAGRGARSIGMVAYHGDYLTMQERMRAFTRSLRAHRLNDAPERIVLSEQYSTGAYEATRELLRRFPDLDALLVGKDHQLSQMLHALDDEQRQIGRDIKLISINETEMCRVHRPGISAIRFSTEEVGYREFELLLQYIEDREAPLEHLVAPVTLVERESTVGVSGD